MMTKLRVRDLLDDEQYLKQRQELERDKIRFEQQLTAFKENENRFEPDQIFISLNNCVVSRFIKGNDQTKRLILEIVGSNFVLADKKLNIEAAKPFKPWKKADRFTELLSFVQDVRTFFDSRSPASIHLIKQIKRLNELSDWASFKEAA